MESNHPKDGAAQLVKQWEAWEKHCKQQLKASRELCEQLERGDLTRARKGLQSLLETQAPPLPDSSMLEPVSQWCQQEERQRPLRFAHQLKELASSYGIDCQTLGNNPPTLRLEPLTVELDFRKGEASFSYARIGLGSCPLEESQVLKEHARQMAGLETSDFLPEDYLARVFEAYRRCLAQHGLRPGDRVDLVDLLPELTFLLQSDKFRKDPTRESFRPYSKARFAFDLARLRRSRQLEYQGHRLSLGTATLGSTRSKDRVLFLEEAGQGQYYLSIAFQGGH